MTDGRSYLRPISPLSNVLHPICRNSKDIVPLVPTINTVRPRPFLLFVQVLARVNSGATRPEFFIRRALMLATIAIVLLVLWLLGFFVVPIGGGLIHLLLVIALIAFIWHFVGGRRGTL